MDKYKYVTRMHGVWHVMTIDTEIIMCACLNEANAIKVTAALNQIEKELNK